MVYRYLTNQKEEFTDYLPFSISHGRKNILKGVLYSTTVQNPQAKNWKYNFNLSALSF